MLDKRSIAILKVLNKLTNSSAYKVVTIEEIMTNITNRNAFDADSLKQILEFLEKQEYINIKFSEDNTYCYSLLPKARIYLEQELTKPKSKKQSSPVMPYVYTMIASFIGTMLALIIFFYLI
ncbi:MAG: hypothetical protein E7374_03910 [Clostridiales bacterium]|nr:hypothetical protein [Clostridiales bacterium]